MGRDGRQELVRAGATVGCAGMEALQLQNPIAAVMEEVPVHGPSASVGELHWKESTGLGRQSKVLPTKVVGTLPKCSSGGALRWAGLRIEWGCGEHGVRWASGGCVEQKGVALSKRELR